MSSPFLQKAATWLLLCLFALFIPGSHASNHTFADLKPCELTSLEISQLGPGEPLEPCIISEVYPFRTNLPENQTSVINIVQVTPSNCASHRDGAPLGVEALNGDNSGKGIAIGFNQDHYVQFYFMSVIAGNPATLSEEEYDERHVHLLRVLLEEHYAPYIVGTCSFASEIEKAVALEHQAIVMAQVGPPGFYAENNPYVFGFHINSDTYPLPNVRALGFLAQEQEGGPSSIPVRVIYRKKSEFFYSTCRSAIDSLTEAGFTDLIEILYDHAEDDDGDGEINQFDKDFLEGLADDACPPGSSEDFHPALFACTLTEQEIILNRWLETGCRPTSTWVTAATWGWADSNLNMVPYIQGGGQWHPTLRYSDKFYDSGSAVLEENEKVQGYMGTYDLVVSYAIAVLYGQHLQAAYRVEDRPRPVENFADPEGREQLRRAMIVLNTDTIFGPFALNSFQRNIGRGAAGSQWLPRADNRTQFYNALVAPLLQAEALTAIPAQSAKACPAGEYINEEMRQKTGAILKSGCDSCPVDTFTQDPSKVYQCQACPKGTGTEEMLGQEFCIKENDNLMSGGVLAFGYILTCCTWALSFAFMTWQYLHRNDPVVKVAQMEFMTLICIGAIVSSSTIIALSFQAGSDESTSAASAGCTAAPFLYAIGWILQYSSLSAKTYRLYKVMENQKRMQRVTISFFSMLRVVLFALAVDLIIVIVWTLTNPLQYVRSDPSREVDEDAGVVTLESTGRCQSEDGDFWAFAGPLIGFHLSLVILTNALLYQVRHVTDRYQESKYVAFASILMFEILVIGIPVLVSVNDNPAVAHIVISGIIAINDIGILCFIFIPKILFQRKGLEEGIGFGESIMKETAKKASTRESIRRDNGIHYSGYSGYNSGYLGNHDSSVGGSADFIAPLKGSVSSDKAARADNAEQAKPTSQLKSSSIVSESIAEETALEIIDEAGGEIPEENILYDENGNRRKPSTRSSANESAAAKAVQATDENLRNEYELMKQRLWKQQAQTPTAKHDTKEPEAAQPQMSPQDENKTATSFMKTEEEEKQRETSSTAPPTEIGSEQAIPPVSSS